MVPDGEIVQLWRCSREITALAQTAGCPTSTTVVSREASTSLTGPAVSRENRGNREESRNTITETDIFRLVHKSKIRQAKCDLNICSF